LDCLTRLIGNAFYFLDRQLQHCRNLLHTHLIVEQIQYDLTIPCPPTFLATFLATTLNRHPLDRRNILHRSALLKSPKYARSISILV
jgi:hypothetical protein